MDSSQTLANQAQKDFLVTAVAQFPFPMTKTYEEYEAILLWLDKHLIRRANPPTGVEARFLIYLNSIYFKYEEDAFHYKMRWM